MTKRSRPSRVGDILPGTAASLGLADELRLARLMATWTAIVEEHVPPAAPGCRVIGVEDRTLVVQVDHPMVGQELHLNETALVTALRASPGGAGIDRLRIRIGGPRHDTPL